MAKIRFIPTLAAVKKAIRNISTYILPLVLLIGLVAQYSWGSELRTRTLFQTTFQQSLLPHQAQFQKSKAALHEFSTMEMNEEDEFQNHTPIVSIPHFELMYCGVMDYFSKHYINSDSKLKNFIIKLFKFKQSLSENYIFIQNFRI